MRKIIDLISHVFRQERRNPDARQNIKSRDLSLQETGLIAETEISEIKPFIFVHDRRKTPEEISRASGTLTSHRWPLFDKPPAEDNPREFENEDDYAAFVERMWAGAQILVGDLTLTCDGQPCIVVSITSDRHQYPYVNMWLDGNRVTYAGDGRHEWMRDGASIDQSAFLAVQAGLPPEEALRFDPYPASLEAALAKDRITTNERRLVIRYCNKSALESWRVVSRIWRGRDYMTARCHFRWGQRRTFDYTGLREIIDVGTGEIIPVREFTAGAPLPHRRASNAN